MSTITDRINAVMKEKNLKGVDLCKSLGISSAAVSTIVSGKNAPSNTTIKLFCLLYNVNEEWLRTGDGEPEATSVSGGELTGVNPIIRAIVTTYQRLNPEARATVDEYINAIVEEYQRTGTAPAAPAVPSIAELGRSVKPDSEAQ